MVEQEGVQFIVAGFLILVALIGYFAVGSWTVTLCGDSLKEEFERRGLGNSWVMRWQGFVVLCLLFPILLYFMLKNSLKTS